MAEVNHTQTATDKEVADKISSNELSSSSVNSKGYDVEESAGEDIEEHNKEVFKKAWTKKLLYLAYFILVITAFIENFAADSTSNLDSYATSSFNENTMINTAAVVYKITAICFYPVIAKIADLLGRGEGFGFSIFIYTIAYVLYAACKNVQTYIVGEIFYAIGRNGYRAVQQIFVADSTNLINRTLYSQIPGALTAVPALYAGSYVMDAFLNHSTWRWGYGAWAIILAGSMIPLTAMMFYLDKKAVAQGQRKQIQLFQNLPEGTWYQKTWHVVFNELDLFGLVLLVLGMALFFVPFTLTGKSSPYKWHEARLIAMLVVGFVIFCLFIVWNAMAGKGVFKNRKPFVPKQTLMNRTVIITLLMCAMDFCENSSFATYFATTLQVGGYLTAGQATRVDNSKKATVDIASVLVGIFMKYTKRSKIFVLIGVPVLVLGHGLLVWMMDRDGGIDSQLHMTVVEIMIGIGRGFYSSALQTNIQAISGVEGIAMSTVFQMAFNSVGSLIGSAIAGGIWNTVVLNKLEEYLPEDAKDKASTIFGSIKAAKKYKKGTAERTAISRAYRETIQIIGWTGLGIICPMLILMWFTEEVKLTNKLDVQGTEGTTLALKDETTDSEEAAEPVKEKKTWRNFWRS